MASFAIVLMTMAVWELAAGRRVLVAGRGQRWLTNLTLLVLGIGVVRVLMPLSVVEIGNLGSTRGWGLFGLLGLPLGVATVVSVVALDLALYLQHVAFHHIKVLWRMHRVHHADPEFDVTTGLRFHPLEFIVSTFVKVAAVLALGAPAAAVVIFEILLNASSMFTHGNGGWTVRQVVHHLPDSHLNSFVRFKWALTEDQPVIKVYHEERWADLAGLPDHADRRVARPVGRAPPALGGPPESVGAEGARPRVRASRLRTAEVVGHNRRLRVAREAPPDPHPAVAGKNRLVLSTLRHRRFRGRSADAGCPPRCSFGLLQKPLRGSGKQPCSDRSCAMT